MIAILPPAHEITHAFDDSGINYNRCRYKGIKQFSQLALRPKWFKGKISVN